MGRSKQTSSPCAIVTKGYHTAFSTLTFLFMATWSVAREMVSQTLAYARVDVTSLWRHQL
jgi:hypothetical protein